ncbi:MAG TPA: lysozyme inhibitor LprI family protein [Burkholderiaceae bacterium]|nr:lysozyme inhibitor LprI family protein [Burkholderiaceae bacterium]
MRVRRFFILVLLLCMAAWASAQTQLDMNIEACADYQAAEEELAAVYQQLVRAKIDDREFVEAIEQAQRAWMAFRDAELKAIYPKRDARLAYGSAHPMCECGALAKLTRARSAALMQWLMNHEGDVCAGSQGSSQ